MSTKTAPQLDPESAESAGSRPTKRRGVFIIAMAALAVTIVAGLAWFAMRDGGERPNLLANGDFETGDLTGWTVETFGSSIGSYGPSWRGWFVYEDGLTPPTDNDRMYAYNDFEIFDPPEGLYAAVTDGNAGGVMVLYRDIKVDGPSLLRATVFYRNEFSPGYGNTQIIAPDDFMYASSSPNQQYRIDLVDPEARILSVNAEDVLATVFRTNEGDPIEMEPTEVSIDLSPWEGRTVRLRCVEVTNQGPMVAGLDNVRVERR